VHEVFPSHIHITITMATVGLGFIVINVIAAIIGAVIAMVGVFLIQREVRKPNVGDIQQNDALLISGLLLAATGLVLVGGTIIACMFGLITP
jgi:hypothetical protein